MVNHACIAIGIDRYEFLQPLQYAQQDAQAFQEFLTTSIGLDPQNCWLLTERSPAKDGQSTHPSRSQIERSLDELRQLALTAKDVVWFFFSGYGLNLEGKDYLLPIDGNPADPETTAIPMQELLDLLTHLATQQVRVFLDISRPTGLYAGMGIGSETIQLARTLSIPILLSCQPQQFSRETSALRHGLFTAALLEALRYKHCPTWEALNLYLCDRLPKLSEHHWRPRQDPLVLVYPPEKMGQLLFPNEPLTNGGAPVTQLPNGNSAQTTSAANGTIVAPEASTPTPIEPSPIQPKEVEPQSSPHPESAPLRDKDLRDKDLRDKELKLPDLPAKEAIEEEAIRDHLSSEGIAIAPESETINISEDSAPDSDRSSDRTVDDSTSPNAKEDPSPQNPLPPAPTPAISNREPSPPSFIDQLPLWQQFLVGCGTIALAFVMWMLLMPQTVQKRPQPAQNSLLPQSPTLQTAPNSPPASLPVLPPPTPPVSSASPASPGSPTPAAKTPTSPAPTTNPASASPTPASTSPTSPKPAIPAPTPAQAAATTTNPTTPTSNYTQLRDRAIAQMHGLPASPFAAAIATARQVPATDPNAAQAKADIERWGQTIWEIAQSRAQKNAWEEAIAAAKLVPQELPQLHAQAQQDIAKWRRLKN
jgi:Caspase domain